MANVYKIDLLKYVFIMLFHHTKTLENTNSANTFSTATLHSISKLKNLQRKNSCMHGEKRKYQSIVRGSNETKKRCMH